MKHTMLCRLVILLAAMALMFSSCDDSAVDESQSVALLTERLAALEQTLLSQRGEAYAREVTYKNEIMSLEKEIARLRGLIASYDTDSPHQGSAESGQSGSPPYQETPEGALPEFIIKGSEAVITGYTGQGNVLIIPESLDGYLVTAIADNALSRCPFVEIVLPDTLKEIGWHAFSESYALRLITIPSGVIKAGYGAFENCSASLTVVCDADSYIYEYATSYGISCRTK